MTDRMIGFVVKHRTASLVVFLFAVLSLGAVGIEITRIDIRFALMTEDMAGRALGLFPTINGHPYADYPSLYNFLSYLTSGGARWLNRWTLSLPTILLSCYIVAVTAAIGDKIHRGTGFYAALFSLFSYEYLNIFAAFSIDIPVAAAAVTIVWAMLVFDFGWRALLPYAAMLVFAFAVRGPLGLIMCGAVTAGVLIGGRRWKAFFVYGIVGAVIGAAMTTLAYYAIIRQGGTELLRQVLDWQIGSRLGDGKPFYYYFSNAMVSFLPVTFFAIVALVMRRRNLLEPELAMPLLWMLVPMVVLSIPGGKHLRYLTPALPAFALLAAQGCVDEEGAPAGRLCRAVVIWLDKLAMPLGILCIAVGASLIFLMPTYWVKLLLHLVLALVMLLAIGIGMRRFEGGALQLIRVVLSFAAVVGIAVTAVDSASECSSIFVRRVEGIRTGRLFLYRLSPDHNALKVMYNLPIERRRGVTAIDDAEYSPQIKRMYPYRKPAEVLPDIRPEDVIVLNAKYLKKLKADAAGFKIVKLCEGRLGHRDSLAVKLIRRGATDAK